jgi:hypothetical protein
MSVLRKIFGPSRDEIWRQLSAEIGGRYVEGRAFKPSRVDATHGEWIVTLDRFVVSTGKVVMVFTRMRAPYVNPDGFRFTVYRRGFFSDVAKWLGMQDVEIGHEPFDSDFIIKGTSEEKLRRLFANERLRDLIAAQKDIKFTVADDEGWFGTTFPDGVDELLFTVPGVITDIPRLKLLFELFSETLDELCRIGSAYERGPEVKL